MADLTSIPCIPCQGGEPALSSEEIKTYRKQINPMWDLKQSPDRIIRTWQLPDFKFVIDFVNKIAQLAEKEGHHPNIKIFNYKNIEIELFTHKIGGLHKNDFILAAKIDAIVD